MSYRTEAVRKGQESRDFMLPKVRSKFNNSHQSLYSYQGKQVDTERIRKKGENPNPDSYRSDSKGKNGYLLNKNMDVNAL